MVDPFNQLRMDYQGVRTLIKSYTSGMVICYLDGLKEAIDNYKKDDNLNYLSKINKWYTDNIKSIQSNDYVLDSEQREHKDIAKSILLFRWCKVDTLFNSRISYGGRSVRGIDELLTNIGKTPSAGT